MSDPSSSTPERILLVDDNATNIQILVATLEDLGHELFVALSGEEALDTALKVKPTLLLLDVMMPPGIDGFEVCRRLKATEETQDVAVIFLTALDQVSDKVRGLDLGAVDFVTKPIQTEEVRARVRTQMTVQRLRRELETANGSLRRELEVAQELLDEANNRVAGALLGESAAAQLLRAEIEDQATHANSLLLLGSHGSGHEAVARAIHQRSSRRQRPFIYVDCAAMGVVEATDFFRKSGLRDSLTDPESGDTVQGESEYRSRMSLADSGTLYLDHLDQLPAHLQEGLLRLVAPAQRERDEGLTPSPDVRVIAYAPAGLKKATEQGAFSRELAELVGRAELVVPALAERSDDILVLAEFFMRQKARRIGRVVDQIDDETSRLLLKYAWPGGVQEMQHVIERQVALSQGSVLRIEPHLLEGVSLGGYQLLEKLGEGGMGEVWRAQHRLLAHPAAVKLIRADPGLPADLRESQRERFLREARVTANLRSSNTVHLYDFGIDEQDGSYYYVMELLQGVDLAELVHRTGAMAPERVTRMLIHACRSLAEAHRAGLVHRDIKPANLFACSLGIEIDVLKVLDFGIVQEAMGDTRNPCSSDESTVSGTPGYMAPEIIHGQHEVDRRADIYSLGCVAYFLLTNQSVFSGNSVAVLWQHANEDPQPISSVTDADIPRALEEVVTSCLCRDPAGRPTSAVELLHRLVSLEFDRPWTHARARSWWDEHLPGVLSGDAFHPLSEEQTVPRYIGGEATKPIRGKFKP